jgi:phospholipase A1
MLLLPRPRVQAQIVVSNDSAAVVDADSLRRHYNNSLGPRFGAYKDNYFVFGTAIGSRPTNTNTNVKFQISIQQRLTNTTLPLGTYLYLFYTQKVFWNVLEDSMPMTDLNFNPGIGIAKPIFSRGDGRYLGKFMLQIEHESNGKDSIWSRSWNRITVGASVYLDRNIMVYGKIWIPIIDGQHNRDILRYCGIYQSGLQIMSNNRRFGVSVNLTKRCNWNPFNYNSQIDVKYCLGKHSNQYLYLQYYNGYGEGLLNYNKHTSELRVGICLSPFFFSDY